jgi:hypothetical protein
MSSVPRWIDSSWNFGVSSAKCAHTCAPAPTMRRRGSRDPPTLFACPKSASYSPPSILPAAPCVASSASNGSGRPSTRKTRPERQSATPRNFGTALPLSSPPLPPNRCNSFSASASTFSAHTSSRYATLTMVDTTSPRPTSPIPFLSSVISTDPDARPATRSPFDPRKPTCGPSAPSTTLAKAYLPSRSTPKIRPYGPPADPSSTSTALRPPSLAQLPL